MMFVTYDPITGNILGRYSCDERQAENYVNKVEITVKEFEQQPELTLKVDIATKTLIPQ